MNRWVASRMNVSPKKGKNGFLLFKSMGELPYGFKSQRENSKMCSDYDGPCPYCSDYTPCPKKGTGS